MYTAVETAIFEAIRDRRRVRIVYHGGSQPGAAREISPIAVDGDKVRAKCHASNAMKVFMMSKISLADDAAGGEEMAWDPFFEPVARWETVRHYLVDERAGLEAMGWHIDADDESVGLYRRYKNGKLLKYPDVWIAFSEYVSVSIFDGENFVEQSHKAERPWAVGSRRYDTRRYGSLDRAAVLFGKWALEFAPH